MHNYFAQALDFQNHPIRNAKNCTKLRYFVVLQFLASKTLKGMAIKNCELTCDDLAIAVDRYLSQYKQHLFADFDMQEIDEKIAREYLTAFTSPWLVKYIYMLVCDMALIFSDKLLISLSAKILKEYLPKTTKAKVDRLCKLLQSTQSAEKIYAPALPLLNQYRANKRFFSKKEKRIIVTANMSAGKSTLINALVGKSIARTAQEVCTGNICYIFNKAFDDKRTHLSANELNMNASAQNLRDYDWSGHISIASYFAKIVPKIPHLCLIDTPGVDAALHKEHSNLTYDALLNDKYDIILYVVNPTRLGTDAEKKHLHWIFENLQQKNIIFVLNKLDNYKSNSDSIEDSIVDFKKELEQIGFTNPIICPISAYFAYLIKLKLTGQSLSEDETDEYEFYSYKFKKSEYDLSKYYEGVQCQPTDSEEIALSKRIGLYGLEKIIYGGECGI